MMIIQKLKICIILSTVAIATILQAKTLKINSPDQKISVDFIIGADNSIGYNITCENDPVLTGDLGIIRSDGHFTKGLTLLSGSDEKLVEDNYTLITGKKRKCTYQGMERVFHLKNSSGRPMDVIFRVSDDGVAFRYVFPDTSAEIKSINKEISGFQFNEGTIAFIQPMEASKSGWSKVNPAYEEFYTQGLPIDSLPYNEPGWVFPALFQSGSYWLLFTETAPDRDYCGCRLQQDTLDYSFYIDFPQAAETIFNGPVNPESKLPWKTPWRIITIGKGLAPVVESTLGTDLSEPSRIADPSFVKPGRSSWSWVLLKDDSTVFDVQKRFIDYASDMTWEYCLIDAFWNKQIGYGKIAELADYAKTKNVGISLWYNSAGDWNVAPLEPRNMLLTHEKRMAEFKKITEMGIQGVKVDFFGGDGQSVIAYYQDIFEDAAAFGLAVNCHGATLPRGWQRTYPNLVSMESVKGFEYVTFDQVNADNQPQHACMQPFTRNVFDPMDYTPVSFSEVPNIRRITSNAFELATSVIFWSGIQHFAEIPAGMAAVPDEVRDFMRDVPSVWDDTRFIDGYPGKYVILARRYGDMWYIAGINGEPSGKSITLKLPFLQKKQKALYITDGSDNRSFSIQSMVVAPEISVPILLKPYGGFVIKVK